MAILKPREIREMSRKDLDKKMDELQMELMKLRAQLSSGSTPKNPGRIKLIKRTLARIITIKKQKEEVKSKKP